MKFDQEDIKAVAKSRINRAENKASNQWTIVALIVMAIGFIVATRVNNMAGVGVMVVGFIVFVYYNAFVLDKKRKNYIAQLLAEWEKEQGENK